MFQVGQALIFSTDSSLYRDIYEARVIGIYPDRLDLGIPLHHGYLLLLPVGTTIRWHSENIQDLTSQVIFRSAQSWSVTHPSTCSAKKSKVIAVGSGKGGVGKTTFSINLSLALSKLKQRVVLMDADLGMANVEVLMGLESTLNLAHVINGECRLGDILKDAPGGFRLLPGSSGISALTQLTEVQFNRIISGFNDIAGECDILILDTGAGITELVLKFLRVADEFLLLTNPEPHALMDAYALMKIISASNSGSKPKIIMNRAESEKEARESTQTLVQAAKQFLKIEPEDFGWLPAEKLITRSIKERNPILLTRPELIFSRYVQAMAEKLAAAPETSETSETKPTGIIAFWQRFFNMKTKF